MRWTRPSAVAPTKQNSKKMAKSLESPTKLTEFATLVGVEGVEGAQEASGLRSTLARWFGINPIKTPTAEEPNIQQQVGFVCSTLALVVRSRGRSPSLRSSWRQVGAGRHPPRLNPNQSPRDQPDPRSGQSTKKQADSVLAGECRGAVPPTSSQRLITRTTAAAATAGQGLDSVERRRRRRLDAVVGVGRRRPDAGGGAQPRLGPAGAPRRLQRGRIETLLDARLGQPPGKATIEHRFEHRFLIEVSPVLRVRLPLHDAAPAPPLPHLRPDLLLALLPPTGETLSIGIPKGRFERIFSFIFPNFFFGLRCPASWSVARRT